MNEDNSAPPVKSRLGAIFVGRKGIRVIWRVILFLLVIAVCLLVARGLISHFLTTTPAQPKPHPGITHPLSVIVPEAVAILILFAAMFVMSRIEKRPFSGYGLACSSGFWRRFGFGYAVGLLGVALQIGLIASVGGYSLGGLALAGGEILKYGALWVLAFLLVAIFEENFFRGYLQVTLGEGIGFWPAALVLALGFGAFHVSNTGETWPGIAMLLCFALLAAFTLRRSGDLWFIIGLHAAWDWAHVFVFSVPVAGSGGTGHLLNASLHGPQWLTGGSAGPDGSVFAFVVLALIAVLVQWIFTRRKSDSDSVVADGRIKEAG